MITKGRFRDECDHVTYCKVCRPANAAYHEASVDVREWAEAIREIVWTAQETKDDAARTRRLLNGIEAIAWGIGQKAEIDIENETTSGYEVPRRPRLAEEPTPTGAAS